MEREEIHLDTVSVREKVRSTAWITVYQVTIPNILNHILSNTDFIQLMKTLYDNAFLTDEQYHSLISLICSEQCDTRQGKLNILNGLLQFVSIVVIEKTVRACFASVVQRVNRREVPNDKSIVRYYYNLKHNIDNAVLQKRLYLWKRIQCFKTDLSQIDDVFHNKRQAIADKLVPLYVSVLHVVTPTNYDQRRAILKEMKESFPVDLDRVSMESVYHSKLALTETMAGNFEKAEGEITKARFLASEIRPCFATFLLNHDEQFMNMHRRQYEGNRFGNYLTRVKQVADEAMRCLGDTPEDIYNQWNRMYTQYLVMSLLEVSPNFKFWNYGSLEDDSVTQAKNILNYARHFFSDIESRRKMIYSLCWSRVHEKTDTLAAYGCLKEASKLAEEGGTYYDEEMKNIQDNLCLAEDALKLSERYRSGVGRDLRQQ